MAKRRDLCSVGTDIVDRECLWLWWLKKTSQRTGYVWHRRTGPSKEYSNITAIYNNCSSFSKRQSQVEQLPLTLWWGRRQCFTFWPLSCNLDTWPRCYGRTANKKCLSVIPMAFHKKNAQTQSNTPVWCLFILLVLGCVGGLCCWPGLLLSVLQPGDPEIS